MIDRTQIKSLIGKKITDIRLSKNGDMYNIYSGKKLILAVATGWSFDADGFRFDNSGLKDDETCG